MQFKQRCVAYNLKCRINAFNLSGKNIRSFKFCHKLFFGDFKRIDTDESFRRLCQSMPFSRPVIP